MRVHQFTSTGRNHVNQDIAGSAGNAFWVIDGATPLFGDDLLMGNDVQTAVDMISKRLEQSYDGFLSLAENLKQACLFVQEYYQSTISGYDQIPPYKLPTFACAMVSLNQNVLKYYVIGDCEIRYGLNGWIRDESFFHVKKQNELDESAVLKKHGADQICELSDAQRKEVHDEIIHADQWQRSRLNSMEEGGYWIGSLDGKGIRHGRQGQVQISDRDPVFVYCDGMAHLIEKKPDILESADLPGEIMKIRSITDDDVTIAWMI